MTGFQRLGSITLSAVVIASLAACAGQPNYGGSPNYPAGQQQPAYNQGYAGYGTVTNVQMVRTGGGGTGGVAGTAIGGVAGGVLGNQVGGGRGRTAATVAGAIGGALIGNAIERNRTAPGMDVYRVTVQLENGAMQSFDYQQAPNVRPGDRVRVDGNQLYR
ncbi:MAG: glycine zipper 2TM domain-containing protein [Ottowia sp.]|uniref:glycine zipper 2TM domain-containing protein n=1 Tax=Ottowia sp. TaxID=1898956 RepID=UPI003C77AEC9